MNTHVEKYLEDYKAKRSELALTISFMRDFGDTDSEIYRYYIQEYNHWDKLVHFLYELKDIGQETRI